MSRIRDRGKMKWQGAFFMPEHVKMLHELRSDYYKVGKPILDEYQIEEFEQNLCSAMEQTNLIKITIWEAGFLKDFNGLICSLDELNKKIYLEEEDGRMMVLHFSDVVGVALEE
jgi:hypothetical protein